PSAAQQPAGSSYSGTSSPTQYSRNYYSYIECVCYVCSSSSEPCVLHQEVSSGFWQAALYLSTEVHQHQHTSTLFQHQPPGILPTPVPPMLATPDRNVWRSTTVLSLLAPMAATVVPLLGPFGSLHGAFQPKTCPPQTSNILDMAPRPRTGSHKLLQKDPRRPGRWNTMHVRIAWQIHHHKLRVKQKMQVDANAINFGVKPEFLTQPPGSDQIQAIPHQRDLIQYSTPLSNPAFFHYSPAPESHSTHPLFGGLGSLRVTTFGGLPNLALNNLNAPSGEEGGTPEWWSRQQKTPPSSVCQPERSTEPEQPGRDSIREPQDREWGQQLHLPREKMEEKQYIVEKHQGHNAAGTHDSSPAEDKSVPQTITLEHGQRSNGSCSWESGDRKRRLECKNYIKVKKIKWQREDDQEDFNEGPQPTEKPSLVPLTTTLTPSSMSMQHMTIGNIIPRLYPVNSVCNLARTQVGTPNMGLIPYHALPWDTPRDPLWDEYRGMDLPASSCQELVMRADPLHGVVGARMLEAADCSYRDPHHSFPHPPHHSSLVLKQQERAYLMERERLHLRREEYYEHSLYSATMGDHLPHPSLLTSTYSRSHISRVGLTQSSLPNRTLTPGFLSTLPPLVPFSHPLSGAPHRTTS
uniref:Activator of transcription and developmental regulator AUTS2 b n=1 Tax=Oncorhynchus tshawytscha TaxID=74940 RepID=A0A8C8EZI7_ONCTS